jgi:hypothetical protein
VADAASLQPDEHLAGTRFVELDLRDVERLSELLEHRGAHLHSDRLLSIDRALAESVVGVSRIALAASGERGGLGIETNLRRVEDR